MMMTSSRKLETGEPSRRDAIAQPTNGGADSVLPKTGDASDWMIAIAIESKTRLEGSRARGKPRIQRVPETLLREAGTNRRRCFEPEVVSLGPYHHGRPQLAAMEEHKRAAAAIFAGESICKFYDTVRALTGKARACYVDEFDLSDEQFAVMMFFDGCFILHFIDGFLKWGPSAMMTTPAHLHRSIVRDIFLLENQVPFMVLEALMSLSTVDYVTFVRIIMDTYDDPSSKNRGDSRPIHLLDLLRSILLGEEVERPPWGDDIGRWPFVRSVMELKAAGINCDTSETGCLRDVRFQKQGLVHGQLRLPWMVVEDLTRPRWLNLVAFELCPDGNTGYGIISYVCLLDSLVNDARDVEELRWRGVVMNSLGTDQQVADMLKDLAIGLSPDRHAYFGAILGMYHHYSNRSRVSIARMLYRHFNSPWATIAFVAAVLLFIMTALQTFFTVFSKFAMG